MSVDLVAFFFFLQISEQAIADAEEHLSAGGGPVKRAIMGSFILKRIDGRDSG